MRTLLRLEEAAIAGLAAYLFIALGYPWWLLVVEAAGLLLLFHSSVDRVLGYGLKHSDSFQNTHLGVIGRSRGGHAPG